MAGIERRWETGAGTLVMSHEPGCWDADYSGCYYSPDMWRFELEGGHVEALVFGTRHRGEHWDIQAYLSWLEDPDSYGRIEECPLAWAEVWWDEVPRDMPMEAALGIALRELELAYGADPSRTDWPQYRREADALLAAAGESV